jgi:hypothetical protein
MDSQRPVADREVRSSLCLHSHEWEQQLRPQFPHMCPLIKALAGDNQEKSQPLFSSPPLFLFSKSLYFLTLCLSRKSLCYLSILLRLKVSTMRTVIFAGFGWLCPRCLHRAGHMIDTHILVEE